MSLNFLRDRMINLPPGFRFEPTDEELVFHYLHCKVFSCPLPASVIPEIDLCSFNPWDLPGDPDHERYFFCSKETKYSNCRKCMRTTSSGYWKAIGMNKQIISSTRNDLVGMKKTFVFYRGKSPKGTKSNWIMHEYSLATAAAVACNSSRARLQESLIIMDNWVVCKVFRKQRNTDIDNDNIQASNEASFTENYSAQQRFYSFMEEEISSTVSSSSSSSNSSCLSDITSSGSDYEGNYFNDRSSFVSW